MQKKVFYQFWIDKIKDKISRQSIKKSKIFEL
jgi:hypothetical protein